MQDAFAVALLRSLGWPAVQSNVTALTVWADSEGVPLSWNNPLAVTVGGFGGMAQNSSGVYAYPTVDLGIAATAAVLRQPNMAHIAYQLSVAGPWDSIWHVVNASPWCAGCQNGLYPVTLFRLVQSLGGGPFTNAAAASAPPLPTPTPGPAPLPPPDTGQGGTVYTGAGPVVNPPDPLTYAVEPVVQATGTSDDWSPHIRNARDWMDAVRADVLGAGDAMLQQFGTAS